MALRTTAVEIVPADAGRAFRDFLDLPYRLRRDDPLFVPPLRRDARRLFDRARHPFFEHADAAFFVARRGGRTIGRIEAIVNHAHNRFHGDRVGFFGAFECTNEPDAARALFAHAGAWLRTREMTVMRGPVTHSTNEECGLLVEGFDAPPCVGMPSHPPYYADLVTGAQFEKAKDLHSWTIDLSHPAPPRLARVAELARRAAGVTLRSVNMRDFDGDARRLLHVYNSAWEKNWGFVPLTEREFLDAAAQLRPLIARYPEGVTIAEAHGEPVAFCLAVVDANQALIHLRDGRLLPFGFLRLLLGLRRVDQGRLLALGVRSDVRNRGIDGLLILHLMELGRRLGHRRAEVGWVLEDNEVMQALMTRVCEWTGSRRTRTYRLFDRMLS